LKESDGVVELYRDEHEYNWTNRDQWEEWLGTFGDLRLG
jgi:hypothetical protein